ncbi:MAG: sodium:proton antiporter [Nitrososphaerota archaeon]|nr:sodium:proton antiporter [Nitrososphaerota archaeon]
MAQTEVALAVFLLIALVASLVSRKIKTPYTTLLVLIGLVLSALPISQLAGVTNFFNGLASGGLFVGLILPPLLFESIMSIKVSDFRAVYRPSLLLATFGVLISALVVGVVLWKVVGLPPLVSFLFAALISPTDVATVLEIFGRASVPSRLATLIEMESVFNDATGIALFTIVLTTASAVTLQPVQAVLDFAYILGGGVLIGLGVAWGARYLQRQVKDTISQIVLTLVAVYGAYGLATSLGDTLWPGHPFSGLIAVAITGLFYGNTVLFNVESKQIAQSTQEFWKVMAFVANAVAFFFIGVAVNISVLAGSVGPFLVAYGVVVMARITSAYPILGLTKVGGSSVPLTWMNTASLGGMRGALAIVLVSAVPLDSQAPVAALTFGVVMLSILLQGPLLTRYIRRSFGSQETLQKFDTYGSMKDIEGHPAPGEALSRDREGRRTDGIR